MNADGASRRTFSHSIGTNTLTGGYCSCIGSSCRRGTCLAGLIAEGETEIQEIQHIERGYSSLIDKLHGLGADIRKVTIPEEASLTRLTEKML